MAEFSGIPSAKVILLGNAAVGKTSIVLQFYKSTFRESGQPTIGAAYISKVLDTPKGKLNLNVWDTAGQERFRSIIPMYLRGAAGVIYVCSTDSQSSFDDLPKWKELIDKNQDPKVRCYVVLNKTDIANENAKLAAEQFANQNGYTFFLTSAKTNTNITELFNFVAKDISNEASFEETASSIIQTREQEDQKSSCC